MPVGERREAQKHIADVVVYHYMKYILLQVIYLFI